MGNYILAHDVGTTGNKAALFDKKGVMVASAYYPYPTHYVKPTWVEQSPEDWWRAVCDSTKEVLEKAKIFPQEIATVSFSGQMMGALPVDKSGNHLRKRAIIWADSRAHKQAKEILKKIGFERFYKITAAGQVLETYSIAKILWQKENEQEIFKKTYKFLQAKDYIICRLTGNFVTDFTDASNSGLLDVKNRQWSDELLEVIGVGIEKLPKIYESVDIAGKIMPESAREIGLLSGTPVTVGAGDMICATTGAGVLEKETCYIYIGSAGWVGVYTEKPLFDLKTRLLTLCHAVSGIYASHHTMYSGGICYQWVKDVICQKEKDAAVQAEIDVYELLNYKASLVPPGSGGLIFLPYMRGGGAPYHNPDARGAFIGLNLAHKRENIVKAVLEGVALNLRILLENIMAKGIQIKEIRFIGGGARGNLWRQIIADVIGKEVLATTLSQEANSLGAAIIGGVGIGIFNNFKEAKKLVTIKEVSKPDLQAHKMYNEVYPIFKESYFNLADVFSKIASFQI